MQGFAASAPEASPAGISLRGGCFCNPGAAEHAFGFTPELSARCFGAMARDGFDLDRLRACLGGAPVGAIRISLGMASVEADVTRVVELLREVGDTVREGVVRQATTREPLAA